MRDKRNSRAVGINTVSVLLPVILMLCVLAMAGCTGKQPESGSLTSDGEEGKRLRVVTTLFPYYDFLRQIAGDRIELVMVLPAGMDSHSFEPTPADMRKIEEADLLICNGGAMETWLFKVLASFDEGEGPARTVTMLDYVDTVEEEHDHELEKEYDPEHDHDPEHNHDPEPDHDPEHAHDPELGHIHGREEDGHGVEIEYDEHIWTSPVIAARLTGVLTDVLCEEAPEHEEIFKAEGQAYGEKLKALDAEIRNIVENGKTRLIVFGDKFPMRYFFEEYGLEYRAAFTGCSSDTEPSAKTIAYLIDKVQEKKLSAVYYLELSSHRVAELIGEETGAEPLLFHSCHNVTRKEFDSGITYVDLMKQNAENLKKGLN